MMGEPAHRIALLVWMTSLSVFMLITASPGWPKIIGGCMFLPLAVQMAWDWWKGRQTKLRKVGPDV
ncbi:MAG: hypothetical protein QOC93_1130 [Actinomycetota bacterium]|jgi:hypothetical protein|nr:hypothetical protein [Actinomycetota bacterium]